MSEMWEQQGVSPQSLREGPSNSFRRKRNEALPSEDQFFRPLRVYAFDPSRGTRSGNHMVVQVPYEKLRVGPIGRRVAVIDYDGARDRYYRPITPDLLEDGGLEPSDSDPRFHQQMAYAVVSHTLRTFDRALGREVRFRRHGKKDPHQLRVFPHGVNEANAYYSDDLRALVFGYFAATMDSDGAGTTIPGQPVFTCLSHDIIVHETCHAVIDGMRKHFLEPTNPDTLAFHEAFSDLIALFQHFTFAEPLLDTIQGTGGLLYRSQVEAELDADAYRDDASGLANPLVQLARQFGESLGTRMALRDAIGKKPDPSALQSTLEPHDRGAILVAAVFEAFFKVYVRKTRDLFRIAGIRPGAAGDLQADLVKRLASEATAIARQFLQLCIRSIEFCPTVDLMFGDFLRAMITVHVRLDREDPDGYRDELIRAFARRGIYPPDVRSLTESSLVWKPPPRTIEVSKTLRELLSRIDRRDTDQQAKTAAMLQEFCRQNMDAFGLTSDAPVAVHSFHEVKLLGGEAEVARDIVVEVSQQLEEAVSPGSDEMITTRGGTTLVIRDDGQVRCAISKTLHEARRKAQVTFANELGFEPASARYVHMSAAEKRSAIKLQALHRGY